MIDVPIGLALAAGALAAVNPCGFAMLPVYAGFLITGDAGGAPRRSVTLGRALALTGAMTAGFMVVFGAFGLLIVPVFPRLAAHLPWATMGIGVLLVAVGVWLVLGRELPSFVPKLGGPRVRRSVLSMTVFGMAFALASLSCTVAPFLAVVAATLRTGSTAEGLLLFAAYAAGMGLVVGVVALAIAVARDGLVRRMRRVLPWIARVTGGILLIVGLYVAYYGWYDVRVLRGGDTDDPVIDAAAHVQRWLAGIVGWIF